MARRKRRGSESSGGSWLDTYADLVTLLMAFFVMLFSSASIEETKWQELIKSFPGAKPSENLSQIVVTPGEGGNMSGNASGEKDEDGESLDKETASTSDLPENFDQLFQYIKGYVEKSGQAGSIEVAKSGNNVFLRLKDNILFDPNKYELKAQGLSVLSVVGDAVKNMESSISLININGHTASVSNYSARVDRTLSSNRANNVLLFFEEQKVFDPTKLISIGFGRNYPVASNEIESERKKNRRVDILIMGIDSKYENVANIQDVIDGDIFGKNPETNTSGQTENVAPET